MRGFLCSKVAEYCIYYRTSHRKCQSPSPSHGEQSKRSNEEGCFSGELYGGQRDETCKSARLSDARAPALEAKPSGYEVSVA